MNEPLTTAILLIAFGSLVLASVFFSRPAARTGIPVVLLFLFLGMLAGEEGLGGIAFADYATTFRLGTIALVLILFDGGLNTPLASLRTGLWPASVLASFGVVATALLVAVAAHFLGFTWMHALLLGAIVSSTDAAAVFSVLRGSNLHLQRRVGATLELESGLNDPMAVLLTVMLTHAVHEGGALAWELAPALALQLGGGVVAGLALGYIGRNVLMRLRVPAPGLFSVASIALACLTYGVTTAFNGSGFLAVYVAGVIIGSSEFPYRSGVLKVHDSLGWLSQIGMFLLLGLLAFPSALAPVARDGIVLGLFLSLIARPLVVAVALLPFRFGWREIAYVGFVGLRGAVPIILATYPVLVGADPDRKLFSLVFFIVVVNALIPGSFVRWLTHKLRLADSHAQPPAAVLDISSLEPLNGKVLAFRIGEASGVANEAIADLPFPEGAAIMLLVRGQELLAAKGQTRLLPGDHAYVFCLDADAPFIQLLFGQREE